MELPVTDNETSDPDKYSPPPLTVEAVRPTTGTNNDMEGKRERCALASLFCTVPLRMATVTGLFVDTYRPPPTTNKVESDRHIQTGLR
jgi:hypothetical protein